MSGRLSERARLAIVIAFAIAMACVESATVFYPRARRSSRAVPAEPAADQRRAGHRRVVARGGDAGHACDCGAGRGAVVASRVAYAAIAFGVWDIFYYVFLRLMSGWPRTLLDWDILFLLPLPWWGRLSPVSIALLMILWGTLATQSDEDATDPRWAWALAGGASPSPSRCS